MTAIDTSKLNEGMRVEYKFAGSKFSDILYFNSRLRLWKGDTWRHEIIKDGDACNLITDLVFPDLQEQDRVEPAHWHPNDLYEARDEKFISYPNWLQGKVKVHGKTAKGEYIVERVDGITAGDVLTVREIRAIPKDPDGELREILVKIADHFEKAKDVADGMLIDRSISQIKSLLAAKGPNVTKEQFEAKWKQLSESRGIAFEVDSAYETFKFFTKNETK